THFCGMTGQEQSRFLAARGVSMSVAKPSIFISWSGSRAKAIAAELKNFFADVVQLPAFFSDNDIPNGEDWFQELRRALNDACLGVVVLTPSNLFAPWLFYEFGAIRALANRKCCPILFGLKQSELPGPLRQAQAVEFNREKMHQLIGQIHKE